MRRTYDSRTRIIAFADLFRNEYGLRIPIWSLSKLMVKLGGTITTIPRRHHEDYEYGRLVKLGPNSFRIEMLETLSSCEKLYGEVVMLGYLLLHMGYLVDDDVWDSFYCGEEWNDSFADSDLKECARCFASNLLLPCDVLKKLCGKDGRFDCSMMAEYFGLSEDKVESRAKEEGIAM